MCWYKIHTWTVSLTEWAKKLLANIEYSDYPKGKNLKGETGNLE